ncbi:hypothetical protein [Parafrankia sp. FMc2]|uniref:hypothetical protein n=1 Tax=Parafrankia sp. FMc2 TaxID=3233196 RepID=UPI0034D6DFE7
MPGSIVGCRGSRRTGRTILGSLLLLAFLLPAGAAFLLPAGATSSTGVYATSGMPSATGVAEAAATDNSPAAAPAFSLSVSPTRMTISPEDIDSDQKFIVTNRGAQPLEVEVKRADFTTGEDGVINLTRERTPYSATDWMTVSPARFRLEPGARQSVVSRIAMPEDPEPGDHHVALIFMVPAPAGGKGFQLSRGIATPLYITVPGPVDDSIRLAGLAAPSFALRGPVGITASFSSTGTVHRDYRGTGVLTVSIDGQQVPFPDFTISRDTERTVTARWEDPPLFCVCHAEVAVTHADGMVQTSRSTIVIFPVHLAAAALAGIAILSLLLLLARRHYRARVRAAARALRESEDRKADAGRPSAPGRPDGANQPDTADQPDVTDQPVAASRSGSASAASSASPPDSETPAAGENPPITVPPQRGSELDAGPPDPPADAVGKRQSGSSAPGRDGR